MKNPMHYQISEYDCGPTSVLNGIIYLFERDEVPPEIIRNVMLYCLDCYNKDGVPGKSGTSCSAMMFLSNWLNNAGENGLMDISSQYLSCENVYLGQNSTINDALKRGGAVVVRMFYDEWHYVLFTGVQEERVYLFDPYYVDQDFSDPNIVVTNGEPFRYNRIVPEAYFNREEECLYSFGPKELREAVVLFNNKTKVTADETIEYFI
jgi:hypothetical protein